MGDVDKIEHIQNYAIYGVDLFIPDDNLESARVDQIFIKERGDVPSETTEQLNGAYVTTITLKNPTIQFVIGDEEHAKEVADRITNRIARLRRKSMKLV